MNRPIRALEKGWANKNKKEWDFGGKNTTPKYNTRDSERRAGIGGSERFACSEKFAADSDAVDQSMRGPRVGQRASERMSRPYKRRNPEQIPQEKPSQINKVQLAQIHPTLLTMTSSCRSSSSRRWFQAFSSTIFVLSQLLQSVSTAPTPLRHLSRRHIFPKPDSSDKVFYYDPDDHLNKEAADDAGFNFDEAKRRHNLAIKYFNEFGYLFSTVPTPRAFKNAIATFQDMAGVPKTGALDANTVELMMQPRCGNSDISRTGDRRKRFVYISRWENKIGPNNVLKLKWYIENYTKDISRTEIKKTVEKAFNLWSSQITINAMESLSLVFEEASSEAEADITILWAVGDHGDAHKFDDAGEDGSNILAHTFYPNYQFKGTLNGDIHLDDFEQWNVNSSREGASFPHVLVHEIGHTLGLGHSKKQQAIMYPIYRKEHLDLMQLDLDDKCAINWSYVGASDLCLYIWLLSEVLPKKIAVEKETSAYLRSETDEQSLWESSEDLLRRKLKQTIIPVCRMGNTEQDNQVRGHLENMLVRRLSFPRQLAHDYSSVLCRFFDGLKDQFDLPTTENFHETFRIHGVHNYFQGDDRFKGLEEASLKDRHFDAEFFDWILRKFISHGG